MTVLNMNGESSGIVCCVAMLGDGTTWRSVLAIAPHGSRDLHALSTVAQRLPVSSARLP